MTCVLIEPSAALSKKTGKAIGAHKTNPADLRLLTEEDVERYKKIFSLQEKGQWRAATHIIKKLHSRVLLGYVSAQKFLHPTKYRSKYPELLNWMKHYADHPQARRIYSLALRRRPDNWKSPPKPIGKYLRGNGPVPIYKTASDYKSLIKRPKHINRQAVQYRKQVKSLIKKGWPTGAYSKLKSANYLRVLHPIEVAIARAEIAHGYFIFGKDKLAMKLAKQSITEYSHWTPIAPWVAGLAAWRLNKTEEAVYFFEQLAMHPTADSNLRSGGAFWASRGHLLNKRPREANKWLSKAAAAGGTFYGMLANQALGIDFGLELEKPRALDSFFSTIIEYSQWRRSSALLQLKKNQDAEQELRSLFYVIPRHLRPSLTAFSAATGMPGFAMRSAGILRRNGHPAYFKALYPFPSWVVPPEVSLDPALVYAIVRQESQFYTKAKSGRGARGLMQLMPRTAASIGKNKLLRKGKGRESLFEPKMNLILGSKYISHLMKEQVVSRNLFKVLAAYNAGPGKLRRWERLVNYKNDPLLFIESIPSKETRHFIKKVLFGLWIYRFRLNEPAPTLNQIASGSWPRYTSVAGRVSQRIFHARD